MNVIEKLILEANKRVRFQVYGSVYILRKLTPLLHR